MDILSDSDNGSHRKLSYRLDPPFESVLGCCERCCDRYISHSSSSIVKVTMHDIMTSIAVTKFGIRNWIVDNTKVVSNRTKVDLKCFILIEINS